MDEWKLPWHGSCRCEATAIVVTAPPLLASACHCTGCQKMTASAFSVTLTVPSEGFEVIRGEPVLGGLRGAVKHHFCPDCKSWMFTTVPEMDWFVNLRAMMLDDPGWVVPYLEVWRREKLPWAETPATHRFETQPDFDAYAKLSEGFAREGARPGE